MTSATTPRFNTREELDTYREKEWEKYTYVFGNFKFRWPTSDVWVDGERTHLSATETDVLKVLINAYPLPLTGAAIIEAMRIQTLSSPEQMKVYIRRLRKKLKNRNAIVNIRQFGYQFNAEEFVSK